jgi:hypothetical protein
VAAGIAADAMAGQFVAGQEPTEPPDMGRRPGRVSLATVNVPVLARGPAAFALCRRRTCVAGGGLGAGERRGASMIGQWGGRS